MAEKDKLWEAYRDCEVDGDWSDSLSDDEVPPPPLPQPQTAVQSSPLLTLRPYLILRILSFLRIREILNFTEVCSQLHRLHFSSKFIASLGMRPSGPLFSPNYKFARRELIDYLQRKTLYKNISSLTLRNTIVTSKLTRNMLKMLIVGKKIVYFSENSGKLVIWELKSGVATAIFNINCPNGVFASCIEPGKIALMGSNTLEVKYFPWETLSPPSSDIPCYTYPIPSFAYDGNVAFFSPLNLVIVTIFNYHILVLSDTLQLIRRINESFYHFKTYQIHPDLPYLGVISNNGMVIFDVSLANRKTPVLEYKLPLLRDYKLFSILISSDLKSKCFLILHNSYSSRDGEVLINGKSLCKSYGDSTVLNHHLFLYNQLTMRIIHYEFSIHGPKLIRSFSTNGRFFDPMLVCIQERCVLVARREHTQNCFYAMMWDYKGWMFGNLLLPEFLPEKCVTNIEKISLFGKLTQKDLKVLVEFEYFFCTKIPFSLRNLISKEEQTTVVFVRNQKQELEKREEFFRSRRAEIRKELTLKRERESLKQSKFWKPSRRGTFPVDLSEDFSLV